LLQERARDLVVKMKDTNLHNRAILVYRDFLKEGRSPRESFIISRSQVRQRDSVEFSYKVPGSNSSSQVRQRDSIEFSSQIPGSNEFSSTLITSTDEKFDRMLNIELPLSLEENSPTPPKPPGTETLQGEPSRSTSSDVLSLEALAIFDRPKETDEGCTKSCDDELIFDISINPELSDAESLSVLYNQDSLTPGSECSWQREGVSDNEEVKNEIGQNPWELPARLGSFPAKDFQDPIIWKVDKIPYKANNLADLRRKHDVLVEGAFKKRCRTKRWRNYYGFFLKTGVMIYFRNKVYKKVADFRKCSIRKSKSKPRRLIVKDVYINNKRTDWPLEFTSANHLNTWYNTISNLEGLKGDNDGILLALGSV